MRPWILLAALLVSLQTCFGADLKLIPTPQYVEMGEGQFDFSRQFSTVVLRPDLESDEFAAQLLREELDRSLGVAPASFDTPRDILIGPMTDNGISECLMGTETSTLEDEGPEAYMLRVTPDRIIAAGNTPAGTFYAIQTLKQLIRANADGKTIPCVTIYDWPELKYRGYSDDISRGPIPTMEFFKRQIRTMSEFKMNMLTFYTEHVFKLEKHPIIAPPDGITAAEVRELSDYAKKYHVELVGNFQSFGHFAHILKHEEYAHLRETSWVITPAKEESYQFLGEVYSEICPAYESKLFNVNCDETWGLGEGPSKPMAEKIGVGRVYLNHMNRIHDMLRDDHGKRMMMWGDIALQHPEMIEDLAQDTILLSWGYGARDNYDSAIEPFVKAGLEFMVCPGVSCWSRIFPLYENAAVNIKNYVRDGAKFGAIGMLNTTWDDDGENLFSWNFYGTNWGAACAWRPADATLEDFDAAYAQVSYGTPDDKVTRAIKLLASCAHNPLTRGNADGAFWVRPFGALATSYDAVMMQTSDLMERTETAIRLLDEAAAESTIDAVDLEYLRFAATRLRYIARARELQMGLAREYTEAVALYPDAKPAMVALKRGRAAANEIVDTVEDIRMEYRRLWLAENRPWWLDRMSAKYDGLIGDLRAQAGKIDAACKEFEKTGVPPDPAAVGLELVETTRRSTTPVPVAEAILPADATWWDARWPHRIALQVEGRGQDRVDYPVEAAINFGKVEVAPESVRVVEYAADGAATALLTQFIPSEPGKGSVVFVMPGNSAKDSPRNFAVYYDIEGSDTKPAQPASDLKLTRRGAWHHVENAQYEVVVGSEGAHMFEWHVKALGGTDITQPGRGGWSGFADTGRNGDRDAHFDITAETVGPVMVRLKATAPSANSEKLFTFYAGRPYVEVMLANPTSFYWDYDNVVNFAADKGTPGTALFSNGHKEPVAASDEQKHAVGRDTQWCAKTRSDGLVLANITPEVKCEHRTGPGNGWGGVGVEGGSPSSHFITFADVVEGDPAPLLNQIQNTLDMRNQPKLRIGKVEKKG